MLLAVSGTEHLGSYLSTLVDLARACTVATVVLALGSVSRCGEVPAKELETQLQDSI